MRLPGVSEHEGKAHAHGSSTAQTHRDTLKRRSDDFGDIPFFETTKTYRELCVDDKRLRTRLPVYGRPAGLVENSGRVAKGEKVGIGRDVRD